MISFKIKGAFLTVVTGAIFLSGASFAFAGSFAGPGWPDAIQCTNGNGEVQIFYYGVSNESVVIGGGLTVYAVPAYQGVVFQYLAFNPDGSFSAEQNGGAVPTTCDSVSVFDQPIVFDFVSSVTSAADQVQDNYAQAVWIFLGSMVIMIWMVRGTRR